MKVRGIRVEPAEVQAALTTQPEVRDAAVTTTPDGAGAAMLVAYVVGNPGSAPTPGGLRDRLARELPDHLVPDVITLIDELPLTAGGKIDYARLPAPLRTAAAPFTAPRTDRERVLAGIAAQLLGLDRIGVHDNLFELGLHSLLAMRLAARADALGIGIRTVDVLTRPTIDQLAAVSRETQPRTVIPRRPRNRIGDPFVSVDEEIPEAPFSAGLLMGAAGPVSRLTSLFHEDASLAEGVSWLIEQHLCAFEKRAGAQDLKDAALAILGDDLLPDDYRIDDVDSEGLWVVHGEHRFPLREMSDGYRTVAALVVDLLKQIHHAYGELALDRSSGRPAIPNPGIVLIDEVDAHLHVTWQKRIGGWLKAHFPAIQFIVTTHSPYICQAADPGGLIRLPAPDEDRPPLARREAGIAGSGAGRRPAHPRPGPRRPPTRTRPRATRLDPGRRPIPCRPRRATLTSWPCRAASAARVSRKLMARSRCASLTSNAVGFSRRSWPRSRDAGAGLRRLSRTRFQSVSSGRSAASRRMTRSPLARPVWRSA